MKKSTDAKKSKTAKTDMEKSHSVWSNTKLTLLSFIASLGFAGFFGTLGLSDLFKSWIIAVFAAAFGGITLFTIFLFGKFKR